MEKQYKSRLDYNNEALVKKKEMEEMMETDNYSKHLRQELTMVYLINNLLLLTTQN